MSVLLLLLLLLPAIAPASGLTAWDCTEEYTNTTAAATLGRERLLAIAARSGIPRQVSLHDLEDHLRTNDLVNSYNRNRHH